MSPRASAEEKLPKYMAVCAGCSIRFEVRKSMYDKIKEDEFVDFVLDTKTKRSLLIATIYLPRCPKCTSAIMPTVDRKKAKTNIPVLLFETEIIKDEKVFKVPASDTSRAGTDTDASKTA